MVVFSCGARPVKNTTGNVNLLRISQTSGISRLTTATPTCVPLSICALSNYISLCTCYPFIPHTNTQEGSSYNLLSNVASAAASPNGEQHVSSSNETSTDGDSEDSSEDQGEQLSQAASDVAVVVVPRYNNGNNSNTNKAAVASGQQQQQKQNHPQKGVPGGNNNRGMNNNGRAAAGQQVPLSFANPKNFAERLMNVLDSGVISDCIWWATDGMAVALHPKKLRKGTVLQDHFSSSSYSGFLRNFNRWCVFLLNNLFM